MARPLDDLQDRLAGFEAGGVDYVAKPLQLPEVVSGASKSDVAKCLAAGANRFLPKPVVETDLLGEIGKLLQLQWIA